MQLKNIFLHIYVAVIENFVKKKSVTNQTIKQFAELERNNTLKFNKLNFHIIFAMQNR